MSLLPPVATQAFMYNKELADVVVATAEEEMLAASTEHHDLYGVDHCEVLSVAIRGDGT